MTDLAPGTMYDYQVGAPSTGAVQAQRCVAQPVLSHNLSCICDILVPFMHCKRRREVAPSLLFCSVMYICCLPCLCVQLLRATLGARAGRRRQLLSADAKPKPHPKPHAKPHPKPHAKPHPKPHPKPHAKPHPKPHAKPHPKPHAKPHPAPTAPRMTAPTAPAADRLPSLSAVRSFKSAPAEDATVKILIVRFRLMPFF
jgi:hypothetical protein